MIRNRLTSVRTPPPSWARAVQRHDLLLERLTLILSACDEPLPRDLEQAERSVVRVLSDSEPARMWLARSILGAELPGHVEMADLLRQCRLHGPQVALHDVVQSLDEQDDTVRVRVARGETTCDVHITANSEYLSGIQRVVRAVAAQWHLERNVTFVEWDARRGAMQTLNAEGRRRLFGDGDDDAADGPTMVVPWQGVHVAAELFIDPERCDRVYSLAKYSGSQVGVIGYDCIPMTTASSAPPGMSAAFGLYLAACRQTQRIAAISAAAAAEYEGWRTMLAGVRETGPEIAEIGLPVTAQVPSAAATALARQRLGVTSAPLVFVVGSHEPRKNHLAVLHAAESLWREGLRFTLAIAGAGSWRAEEYYREVQALQSAGRPVLSISGLSDELLWAGYRLAHCTLFPSFNEGFGLPVAESLAAGTPVITSNFGSTRDIVAPTGDPWGGLLVDPHDDDDIAAAIKRMLTEPETHRRLCEETTRHDAGSWETYADRVWDFLVEGREP